MNVVPGAGGAGGSGGGDERDKNDQNPQDQERRSIVRHSADQTSRLEELFLLNPHPDEGQRRVIAQDLGLEPKQIKFWFQNKRTHIKFQNEREDNNALRVENERIKKENQAIQQALKNMLCQACGGPTVVDIDQAHSLQLLKFENKRLKDEHDKVSKLLSRYMENPLSETELRLGPPSLGNPYDGSLANRLNSAVKSASLNLALSLRGGGGASSSSEILLPSLPKISVTIKRAETHRALMYQAANDIAKEELLRLLGTDEPYWILSPTDRRRLVLHPLSYNNVFARANHFKTPTARVESSKDYRIVKINAMQLVNMMLDPENWINLFSTIISKALILEVLEPGMPDTRHGALQLMYEEMHILSPLVPPREFFFLRYCQQVEPNAWVIGDVSFDYKKKDPISHDDTRAWKRPSGCMIQGLPNGCSRITWVEHVEVDDELQIPWLYRDLVTSGIAYGAERWLTELQRICDRFANASSNVVTSFDMGGVLTLPEGRRNLMRLTQRMVKSFCGVLNMSSKLDFTKKSTVHQQRSNNSGGVRISVRRNTERGNPIGTIVVAAISLWLPLASQQLFDFFRDAKSRAQWDSLVAQQPVHEIAHVSSGPHPGNYISIIRSVNTNAGNAVLIVQETFTHPLGSYVIFTPMSVQDFTTGVHGGETQIVPILPSGITISEDGEEGQQHCSYNAAGASSSSSSGGGNGARPRGSLLTLCYQLLLHNNNSNQQGGAGLNMETVAAATSLINTTVQRIKVALNCPVVEYN